MRNSSYLTLILMGVLVTFFVPMLSLVRAESSEHAEALVKPDRRDVRQDRIGSGFPKNQVHAGVGVGGGLGAKKTVKDTEQKHDLVLASIHYGWIFTDVMLEDHWYRGNLELLAELCGGGQVSPSRRYLFGLSLLPRYNFATGSSWVPFVDFGAGIALTNIEEPDLSTKFQFILQGGFGTHYFLRNDLSLVANYRFFHLSNANISEPNNSVNTHMLFVGISWFF